MSEQYFSEQPDVASDPKEVQVSFGEREYVFTTDRGVFSYERVDKATRILIDIFLEKYYGTQPDLVVDVGCGYGVIATALAHRFVNAQFVGVEPNERARDLAVKNYATNVGDDRLKVVSPTQVDDLKVDLIVSNPPIRIGKEALYELLSGWSKKLNDHGQMWLVIAKNLGADTTAQFLEAECALKVHRVASKKGFRVFRCNK